LFLISSVTIIYVDSFEDKNDQNLNKNSISHNAIGHESHQIVNLINETEDKIFNGKVKFTATLPVDIISYTTTQNNTTNSKSWNIDGKYYTTNKLLSSLTTGILDFKGSGLVAHRPSSDEFQVNFTINTLEKE
jgi:hypothetical protein